MRHTTACKAPARARRHPGPRSPPPAEACCLCRLRPTVKDAPLCFGCRELYESGALNALPIASSEEEYTALRGARYARRSLLDISPMETARLARFSHHPADPTFILLVRQLLRELHRSAAGSREVHL